MAEQQEQEEVKRLVLNYNQRQEEEIYNGMLTSSHLFRGRRGWKNVLTTKEFWLVILVSVTYMGWVWSWFFLSSWVFSRFSPIPVPGHIFKLQFNLNIKPALIDCSDGRSVDWLIYSGNNSPGHLRPQDCGRIIGVAKLKRFYIRIWRYKLLFLLRQITRNN